ncbi:MAG: DAK2 domain-containing protein [Oscillospiraceae bacterium]|nr:DAK2 domain-containing protein [Oscillospiraceae bacterium]
MIEKAGGVEFTRMIVAGAAGIDAQRQLVNELNVFPVPDGDTGTNMSLSLGAAATELKKTAYPEVGRVAEVAAAALLRGARGNSGVILSLLFRGIAAHLKGKETMDGADWADALQNGTEMSYRAVMKPTEGTMLTAFRVSAASAAEAAAEQPALEHVLDATLQSAEIALAETIHQNPVLERAGVIDAGAKGYCIILENMLAALQGRDTTVAPQDGARSVLDPANFSNYTAQDIKYNYCTEFIVEHRKKKDPLRLRALLESLGDSLVMVDDEEIIKIHVHTNHPGKVLEEALTYGPLTAIKIENMREQHSEQVIKQEGKEAERQDGASTGAPAVVPIVRHYGFVVVCAGAGLGEVFRDLGADQIINGGQTMNPSTEDILHAINQTPAEVVIVLPNNKNIILAAEQCVPLSSRQVVVVPTKTIPQGVAAMLAFETARAVSDNKEAMQTAARGVSTGQITYAARDSQFDGSTISAGDHIALTDHGLVCNHPDRAHAARYLAQELALSQPSFVTIFYGEGVSEEEAERTANVFAECCEGAELQVIDGGQPVYYYLVSAE